MIQAYIHQADHKSTRLRLAHRCERTPACKSGFKGKALPLLQIFASSGNHFTRGRYSRSPGVGRVNPLRNGVSFEEFVSQTRARIKSADTKLVVIDGDLAGFTARMPETVDGFVAGIGPGAPLDALAHPFTLASRALDAALVAGAFRAKA